MDIHTETATPVAKPGWLISRNFALLWIGQTISAFGSRITVSDFDSKSAISSIQAAD